MRVRALVGLALLTTAAIASAEPSVERVAWVRAAAAKLPVYFEDTAPEFAADKSAQLDAVSLAVARAASMQRIRSPREWSALLLAVGFHESTYSLRIHRGDCRLEKRECDAKRVKGAGLVARAKSPWQLHENTLNRDSWPHLTGIENTDIQALEASAALQRGFHTCSRSGVHWLRGTINGFAGRRCDARWSGLESRIATYSRLVGTPSVKQGGAS